MNGTVWFSRDGQAKGGTLSLGPGPVGTEEIRTALASLGYPLGSGRIGAELNGLAFSPEGRYLAVPQENGLIAVVRVPRPPED
jgi:hypothetical protein